MPIEMESFTWASPELRAKEWAYAKEELAPGGQMLPDGTKLRRKDNKSTHSFIVLDQKIFAMAPQKIYLGQGAEGHAKLAEDEDGGLHAIKITKAALVNEAMVAGDLGKALKSGKRSSGPSGVIKHYVPYQYLGLSAGSYLANDAYWAEIQQVIRSGMDPDSYLEAYGINKNNPGLTKHTLSPSERVDLGIKIVCALHALHMGKNSKTGKKYTHGDMFPGNITIDNKGNVHLIDYSKSREVNQGFDPIRDDINMLMQRVILPDSHTQREVFTWKMKYFWPFPTNYNAATSILDAAWKLESFKLIAQGMSDTIQDFSNDNHPVQTINDWKQDGKLKNIISNANNLASCLAGVKNCPFQADEIQRTLLNALGDDYLRSLMQDQRYLMYKTVFSALSDANLETFKAKFPFMPPEEKPDSVILIESDIAKEKECMNMSEHACLAEVTQKSNELLKASSAEKNTIVDRKKNQEVIDGEMKKLEQLVDAFNQGLYLLKKDHPALRQAHLNKLFECYNTLTAELDTFKREIQKPAHAANLGDALFIALKNNMLKTLQDTDVELKKDPDHFLIRNIFRPFSDLISSVLDNIMKFIRVRPKDTPFSPTKSAPEVVQSLWIESSIREEFNRVLTSGQKTHNHGVAP